MKAYQCEFCGKLMTEKERQYFKLRKLNGYFSANYIDICKRCNGFLNEAAKLLMSKYTAADEESEVTDNAKLD